MPRKSFKDARKEPAKGSGGGELKKTPPLVFDKNGPSVYRLTVFGLSAENCMFHKGWEYKPSQKSPQDMGDHDVVLPNPDTGAPTVYVPGDFRYAKRQCLKEELGTCPACETEKARLPNKDPHAIKRAQEVNIDNFMVWRCDAYGNLVGRNSGKPVDAEGNKILLGDKGVWEGEYDQQDTEVDLPIGEVHYHRFNEEEAANIWSAYAPQKRYSPVEEIDFVVQVTDPQFHKATYTAQRPEDSAAHFMKDYVKKSFEEGGIKALEKFLPRRVTYAEMVYEYGLERSFLDRKLPEQTQGDQAPERQPERQPSRRPPPPQERYDEPPPPTDDDRMGPAPDTRSEPPPRRPARTPPPVRTPPPQQPPPNRAPPPQAPLKKSAFAPEHDPMADLDDDPPLFDDL